MTESLVLAKIFPDQDAVRAITQEGQTWFCNKDACAILGLKNHRSAYSSLDDNDKTKIGVELSNGVQEMGFINESGLYELFLNSRAADAKVFRKWVSSQILPSLRKNGSCTLEDHERSRLLTIISDLENSKKQVEEQKLKVEQDLKKTDDDKKHVEIKLQIADAENKHITILHENMKKKKTRFKCQKGPCVYLQINELGHKKVGYTGNMQERLAYYETAQSTRANLVYVMFSNNAKIVEDAIKAKYENNRAPNKEWIIDIDINVLKADVKRLTVELSGDNFTELTEDEIHKKWDHLIASKRWEVKNPTSEKSATRIQNLIGETKKCAKCKEEKSKDEFGKDKNRTDGLSCYCKPCKSAKTKEYGKKIREEKENSDPNDQSDIKEKKCTKCEELLPLDNFHAKTGSKDEKQPICKKCVNEAKQQSRLKHKGEEHQCQHCSKTYKLKDSLTRHVKEKHSPDETVESQ